MHTYNRLTTSAFLLLTIACADTATPPPAPLTPATLTIVDPGVVRDGDVLRLRAVGRTADSRVVPDVPVRWASIDPMVATVTAEGVLTALREGTTDIVATLGAVQGRRRLFVVLHPAVTLEVTAAIQTIPLGARGGVTAILRGLDGRLLHNRPVVLESSNPAVARVTAAMEIIPVTPGTAIVTARYGALSATVQVRVPSPIANVTYDVRTLNGAALPVVISEEVERNNGVERVLSISRLESGVFSIGDQYAVSLSVVHVERVEANGATSERVLSRQTIRDNGQVQYDWLTGVGLLQSTVVGGLTHTVDAMSSGVRLHFREAGTTNRWVLGLELR